MKASARAAEEDQLNEAQKEQQLKEKLEHITQEQEGEGDSKNATVRRPMPSEPQIQYEPTPEPPNEPSGVGVNKKVVTCFKSVPKHIFRFKYDFHTLKTIPLVSV